MDRSRFSHRTALLAGAVGCLGIVVFCPTASAAGLDGFTSINGDTVLTPGASIGVTLDTASLKVDVPSGVFWGMQTGDILPLLAGGAETFSWDMTLNNIDLNGGTWETGSGQDFYSGYAQANEMAVVLTNQAGTFIQRNFTTGGATDSLGQNAQWNGVDGTRTITFDLTTFTTNSMTVADYINSVNGDGDTTNDVTGARIWMVTQWGNDGTILGDGTPDWYFDNVRVGDTVIGNFEPIPEPGTLALLGLALPALAMRRRR